MGGGSEFDDALLELPGFRVLYGRRRRRTARRRREEPSGSRVSLVRGDRQDEGPAAGAHGICRRQQARATPLVEAPLLLSGSGLPREPPPRLSPFISTAKKERP